MSTLHFSTQDAAVTAVSLGIKNQLEADITANGKASLVLTGGKTVQPFLKALADLPIEWSKVWVILSDERWVPVDDDNSNEKQLKTLFLDNLSHQPHYIRLKTKDKTPDKAIPYLEEALKKFLFPVSSVLLSVGPDGHVASLFPGAEWGGMLTSYFHPQLGLRISLGIDVFKACQNNWACMTQARYNFLETQNIQAGNQFPLAHFGAQLVVF